MSSATAAVRARLARREVLKTAAAGLLAVPSLVPARALGKDGKVAPSERILLGGIGLGGRGRVDLNWMLVEPDVQFLAICDPNKSRREIVKKIVDEKYGNKDCVMYPDIREYLALRTDLDAVLIATGDRWHALASIMAMRAGKDVYCEKPSSLTIAEGQMVVATARQYGRVYQSGTQGLSMPNRVFGIELARSGRLGKLHTAYAQLAPWGGAIMRHDWLPAEPEPPKEENELGRLAGALPVAAVQLRVRARRVAAPLRFPHQLHRRMGRPHDRPGSGGHRLARHLGRRVRVRRQPDRRRPGRPLPQRRED